jgi:putative hemolysin
MKLSFVAIAAMGAVFFSGCGSSSGGGFAAPPASSSAVSVPSEIAEADGAAAAYCRQTGGQVEVRHAVYGSNGPSLLFLAGVRSFCQYTRKKDGSRIHILLTTLYTTKPTLAALAYILKPPVGSCQGNPASCYCSYLGGSDQFGGTTGAGGGWYKKNSIDQTLEACIFPDMSSIDSWGLAYHANGIIRGINLEKVMRYKYPGHS